MIPLLVLRLDSSELSVVGVGIIQSGLTIPLHWNFFWHRPPYIDDPVRENFKIIPLTPENPIANTAGSNYFDCFRVEPKIPVDDLSMEQIASLLSPVLTN